VIAEAEARYKRAEWTAAYELLEAALAETTDELEAGTLTVALVEGTNHESFKRGLHRERDAHALLDQAEAAAEGRSDWLLGHVHLERGMRLHLENAMAVGDNDRELASFELADKMLAETGDVEGSALAKSMTGIFHHVNLLDRETAVPILRAAYDASPSGPSAARAEATRHLGQIQQELGDPAGALPTLEESLRCREESGWELLIASSLHTLGYARLESGDLEGAERDLAKAEEIAVRLDAPALLPFIRRAQADLGMARYVPNLWRRSHP
jgi:tetratricopeptide (TPR) repeat protein